MVNRRKIWLACGASLGLPLSALAQEVKDVQLSESAKTLSVHVVGDNLARPSVVARSKDGGCLTLEWKAGLLGRAKTIPVNQNDVASVWYGWFSARPRKVRMQIRTTHPIEPTISPTSDGWTITIGEAGQHIAPAKKADAKASKPAAKKADDSKFPDQVPPLDTAKVTPPTINPPAPKPQSKEVSKSVPELKFPDRVPPLDMALATAPAVKHSAHPAHKAENSEPTVRRVSLECTNANMTEILKGLAMQSGANVIIGPGLDKMTVSADLHDVTIDQALDYVSSLTGAKYAKVEGTYVVSRDGGEFDRTMSGLINRTSKKSVVRVVPLASGAGPEVRLALDKWFSPGTLRVVDPNGGPTTVQAAVDSGPGAAMPVSPTSPPAGGGAKPGAAGNDNYIILIGEPKWVDAGEQFAREVDQKIVDAKLAAQEKAREQRTQFQAVQIQEAADQRSAEEVRIRNESPITKAYSVQNGSASDLKDVVTTQSGTPQVSLVSSPKGSLSQVIVCQGTEVAVDRMIALLQQLDTGSKSDAGSSDEFVSYNVKFADPRALREAIISQIPGLRAMLPPNTAGTSNLYKEDQAKKQATDVTSQNMSAGQNGGSSQSANGNAGGGSLGQGAVTSTTVDDSSFELPFTKEEAQAVPMRLLLRGTHTEIVQALKFLEVLDVAPKQVAIELRVMDLSKQDAINAGIDWNILTGGAVKILNLNNSQANPSNSVGVSLSGKNFNGDVTASLDRIASRTNLIARPNMLALDGRQSEIFVGDIVRYIQSITNSQNGQTVTTGEVPVGVRLSVLPRVGDDGDITLDLRPRVSILDSFTDVPGGGKLPQTSSRMAQSTISLKSGQTIAIGGLIQDEEVRNMSGIPFLMDLPFLGHLFRKTTTSKQRSEVVIFLTARSIDGPVGSDMSLPIEHEMTGSKKGGGK